MQYTTLGRTGLRVSVAGLGCGGFSRLGQGQGSSVAQSIDVVRAAIDAGVNFLDTAENYGTEDIVGQAVTAAERDKLIISTKSQIVAAGERRSPAQVVASLHASLRRLRTERVEVFHLHAVAPQHVDYAIEFIAPALLKERDAGRIAHLHTNIQSILADPLPAAAVALARERFGHLVGVGLDAPNNAARPPG